MKRFSGPFSFLVLVFSFFAVSASAALAQCPSGDTCSNGGCAAGTTVATVGQCGNCPVGTTVRTSSTGTNGNDCFVGGTGTDSFDGRNGDDFICGNGGIDSLQGGGNNDIICGGTGDDLINGDNGDDYIDGGAGNDSVFGGSGNDTVRGGSGDDILDAQQGDDTVYGEEGNDTIIGGPGTDVCADQPAPVDGTCETATYALVSHASVQPAGSGLLFSWRTVSEAGTVGFVVMREKDDLRIPLERGVLPAVQHAAGGAYQWFFPINDAESRYVLAEVDASGQWRDAATFVPGSATAQPFDTYVASPHVRFDATKTKVSSFAAARTLSADDAPMRVRAPAQVPVELDVAELASGFGLTENEVAKRIAGGALRIERGGKPVPFVLSANGVAFVLPKTNGDWGISPTATVSFQGSDSNAPLQAAADTAAGLQAVRANAHFEENVFAATAIPMRPDGDVMHWAVLAAGNSKYETFEAPVSLPGFEQGAVTLSITMRAATPGYHRVHIGDGGQDFGVIEVGSNEPRTYTLEVPTSADLDRVVFSMRDKPEWLQSSIVYLDDIRVSYDATFEALRDGVGVELQAGDRVSQALVPAGGLWVAEEGVSGLRQVEIEPGVSFVVPVTGRYFRRDEQGFASATYAGRDYPSAIGEVAGTEMLIVAADGLLTQADAIKELHAASGLRVETVSIQDIYDEFSEGDANPDSIRRFLVELSETATLPRYLLLVGSGHLDHGTAAADEAMQVPPRTIRTRDGLYADDGRHADIDGDGFADIAVGRITGDAKALETYVGKARRYLAEGRDVASERWDFVADAPFAGADFELQWRNALGEQPANLLTLTSTDADRLMRSLLGGGPVAYLGHGSMAQLGKTPWVTQDDLTETLPLSPIVVAGACTVGRYEVPGTVSIAEHLLTGQAGGPMAVWAPSGVSYSEDAARIAVIMHEEFTSGRHARLGDVLMATQARARSVVDGEGAVATQGTLAAFANIFELFGDPATPLRPIERSVVSHKGIAQGRSATVDAQPVNNDTTSVATSVDGCHVGAIRPLGMWSLALVVAAVVARRRRVS